MPVANTAPLAVGTINDGVVIVSAANTNRDGTTGAYTTLYTAGANGAIINRVRASHAGAISVASTAMVLRLWHTSGATTVLIDEVALPSVTPTASVIGSTATFSKTNITMKAADILKVTISVAEAVHFCADQGGDY